jgi:hypothetical protein
VFDTGFVAKEMAEGVNDTISSLIGAVERGEGGASETLFARLYGELHRLPGVNSRGRALL